MKSYHLLWSVATNRLVIHNELIRGYVIQKTIKAKSWLDAKLKLGFDLTPLQQEKLDAQNNRAEADRRVERHKQDAGEVVRLADSELQDWSEAGEDTGIGL